MDVEPAGVDVLALLDGQLEIHLRAGENVSGGGDGLHAVEGMLPY